MTGQATTWCAEWWRHGEANARLTALWLAWEHLRQDPGTGASVWWRDHADHHMAVLLSTDGPLMGCGHGGWDAPHGVCCVVADGPPRGFAGHTS